MQMVGHQSECVLQEDTIDVVGLLVGFKVDGGLRLDEVTGAEAKARTPDEILPWEHCEVIDEIQIDGASGLAELGALAVGAVEVGFGMDV